MSTAAVSLVNHAQIWLVAEYGMISGPDELFSLLTYYLSNLQLNHARQILFVADGARWIWNRLPLLMESLGCQSIQFYKLLDFHYYCEYLADVASLVGWSKAKRKSWISHNRKRLLKGGVCEVITEISGSSGICVELKNGNDNTPLNPLSRGESGPKTPRMFGDLGVCRPLSWSFRLLSREFLKSEISGLLSVKPGQALQRELNYFKRNQLRMDYALMKEQPLPLSSGAIESVIRRVVNLALAGHSIFWLEESANALLLLRSFLKSGRWELLAQMAFAPPYPLLSHF